MAASVPAAQSVRPHRYSTYCWLHLSGLSHRCCQLKAQPSICRIMCDRGIHIWHKMVMKALEWALFVLYGKSTVVSTVCVSVCHNSRGNWLWWRISVPKNCSNPPFSGTSMSTHANVCANKAALCGKQIEGCSNFSAHHCTAVTRGAHLVHSTRASYAPALC